MKKYRRFSLIFVAVLIVIFTAAEMILISGTDKKENERPYRVEINRVVNELRRENQVPEDLSVYRYITKIEKLPEEDFGLIESDYVTVRINGGNYRISYEHQREADYSAAAAAAVIFSLVLVLITVLLVYIGNRIISPFHRLRELPYELSKGNLVKPLEESKNRFFGKFLWGVELLGKKLREEKAKELELQKEKNTLMLSLSHDIKTPLSAIKLYSKALSRGLYTDPEKQLEISENIGAKADEIESFLEQIINAAKEDFLSFDVKDGEFYLSDLTESIHSYYDEKLALLKVEFAVESYSSCLVKGDIDRANEVIQNIMENAVKYGDGRYIRISFGEDDGYILVSVINSGCTLSVNELPHIFESFWRGGNSETADGSGLGLYICRQLTRKMGGDIYADINGDEISVTAVFKKA